ncbi:unnamed protein product [Toxocara canis]|uniref:Cornichon family AMPA receptor auxiliary protein 3 n=1 Tax=Toxocara canis TaxID=6265 RepID=A0A183UVL8_TOXCA|nr:unnamed protein product [Toxocara canis]
MLSTIWLLLCIVIGCVQLLVATQLEWLVNGDFVQGLWAICKLPECHIRESLLSLSVLVMYLLGAVLLLLSAIVSLPIVWSKKVVARSNDAKRLGLVANVQFIAGERDEVTLMCFFKQRNLIIFFTTLEEECLVEEEAILLSC